MYKEKGGSKRGILLDSPKWYNELMKLSQLPLFLQGKLKKAAKQQTVEPVTPTADNTVMQTLPAYMAFLGGSGYSESTTEKYFADVRRLSLFLREKKLPDI